MPSSEKDRSAEEVVELRAAFDGALETKRKYPVQEFKAFVEGVSASVHPHDRKGPVGPPKCSTFCERIA